MRADHTLAQKVNYLKYLFSKKGEILRYDPVTISIVATTRCTLSCDMCPTHSSFTPRDYPHTQKNVKDIDFEMFEQIIERFKKATEVHIIGAGEPLLNKDFFRMADYAAKRKMRVKTFSNGTTVEHNIDKMLNSRLAGITISINGHNQEEFRRMTGMDGKIYSKIYAATKKLVLEKKKRKSKIMVKLSFIIDSHNYKYIPDMINLSRGLGVDHAFFCNFLPFPSDNFRANERMLMARDEVVNELNAMFGGLPRRIRKKITLPKLLDEKTGKNNCDTHFSQIRFDGDGNVSSCSMMLLDMTGHGNYRDIGLWNNEFFRGMRKMFIEGGVADIPGPCRVCPANKGVTVSEYKPEES